MQISSYQNQLEQCNIFWSPMNLLGYGNGYCDINLNNAENFFDAGDCCLPEFEELCINSNLFCNEETLGDGICQDFNNGPLCDYDLGDCCIVSQNIECAGKEELSNHTQCCFCRSCR